jgi:predicted NodU family carbamoyl transferase
MDDDSSINVSTLASTVNNVLEGKVTSLANYGKDSFSAKIVSGSNTNKMSIKVIGAMFSKINAELV